MTTVYTKLRGHGSAWSPHAHGRGRRGHHVSYAIAYYRHPHQIPSDDMYKQT